MDLFEVNAASLGQVQDDETIPSLDELKSGWTNVSDCVRAITSEETGTSQSQNDVPLKTKMSALSKS